MVCRISCATMHLLRAVAARVGRERDADRVADAFLQQHRHRGRGGDDALRSHAGLGEAEVQRVVAARGEVAVHADQVLHAAHLAGDDDAVVGQARVPRPAPRCRARRRPAPRGPRPPRRSGSARFEFSSIRRVSRSWSRLPQFTPMRTGFAVPAGDLDHLGELRVALAAAAHVARVDAVLGQRLGAVRVFAQQLVAVEVEVADQRHVHAELAQRAPRSRAPAAAASSVLTVMRTSSEPACASARTCSAVDSTSAVSVLVMDCTTSGWSPPIVTRPTRTGTLRPARQPGHGWAWATAATSARAIQRCTLPSSTSSGMAPLPSTTSWNARRSKRARASTPRAPRSSLILSSPIL